MTHRSATRRNNERLEFLGDAVLDSVISDALLRLKPDADEGELSRLRSMLVRDRTLAAIANEIELGRHLSLGPGEKKAGGYRRQSILADAIEAIFGAIFQDGGYPAADRAIRTLYRTRLETLPVDADLKDAKTRLQELLQGSGRALPTYSVVAVTGKAHQQSFEVECRIEELDISVRAHGGSRRKAEQGAAQAALERLRTT